MKNYYAVLGVAENADQDEIKVAYRLNAKRYHPDLNPENESFRQRFIEVKNAYEILSNAEERKKYDKELETLRKAREAAKKQAQEQTRQMQAQQAQARQAQTQARAQAQAQAQTQQAYAQQAQARAQAQQQAQAQAQARMQQQAQAQARAQAQSAAGAQRVPPQFTAQTQGAANGFPPPNAQSSSGVQTGKTNGSEIQQSEIEELKKLQRKELEDLKKEHAIQLELMRVSAQEELLRYKKSAQVQVTAFKKQVLKDRKNLRVQFNKSVASLSKKLKRYKENIKKSTYHSGMRDGIKMAQESAQNTISQLKLLVGSAENHQERDDDRLGKIQEELRVINEKNEQLKEQIELFERLSKLERDRASETEELAEDLEEVSGNEDLSVECDELKLKVREYEEEIDTLNDEIAQLEGLVKLWQDSYASGNSISEEEIEQIQDYEGEQRLKSKATLYGILGVYLNALPVEIETAYRRLAKRYEGKEKYLEQFMEIVDAYEILSNPELKRAYDLSIDNESDF